MRALLVIAAIGRAASAAPLLDHVVAMPSAYVPAENAATGTAGLDRYGATSIDLGYGLGGVAEVELGVDSDARACDPCSHDTPAPSIYLGHAVFRLAAREDEWFAGQPALVLGVRANVGTDRKLGEAYVVASRQLGIAAVHAGVAAIDAGDGVQRMHAHVRPMIGAQNNLPSHGKSPLKYHASLVT